ncbi:hypothetical protein QT971_01830 [Microcoleus sp. herbarium19]|uniref:hypothetical protein n=1 Tax=unclassified Microcoleus TaxID=2642155 RepID=UPI002FD70F73
MASRHLGLPIARNPRIGKGSGVPCIDRLLGAASIALELRASEDEPIARLLDCGALWAADLASTTEEGDIITAIAGGGAEAKLN